jgi:hypothetical protein
MLAAPRQDFPGALAAWLTKQDDGSRLDVIHWRSRQEAEEAAKRIDQVPQAKRWFRHIAESKAAARRGGIRGAVRAPLPRRPSLTTTAPHSAARPSRIPCGPTARLLRQGYHEKKSPDPHKAAGCLVALMAVNRIWDRRS